MPSSAASAAICCCLRAKAKRVSVISSWKCLRPPSGSRPRRRRARSRPRRQRAARRPAPGSRRARARSRRAGPRACGPARRRRAGCGRRPAARRGSRRRRSRPGCLVEERELQRAVLDELLHLRRLQRGDPGGALAAQQLEVGLVTMPRSETTITRESPKRLRSFSICAGSVLSSCSGPRTPRPRPGSPGVAEQPVDDLERAPPAVARVAELGKRAAAALEVGGGDVVEDERALARR